MKLADNKLGAYIHYSAAHNKKNPKFRVGDHLIISKYKNIFAKGYSPNCSEEVFVKNNVPWIYVISSLYDDEIVATFYEKELQKTNQTEFRVEKVIKR